MDQVSLTRAAKRGCPPYETSRSARTGYGADMGSDEPILRGQDENAPFRAFSRVFLVVAGVVVLVGVALYALWSALN
jgi:hypothetical protein